MPRRLPGKACPYAQPLKAELGSRLDTDSVDAEKGWPSVYARETDAVLIVRTPPFVDAPNWGTGVLRFMIAMVESDSGAEGKAVSLGTRECEARRREERGARTPAAAATTRHTRLRSSNTPAVFAYSMRMTRSVRTVNRAMPSGDVTTALGSATGL